MKGLKNHVVLYHGQVVLVNVFRIALFLIMNQYALELSPKAKVKPNEHLFVFPQGLLLKAQKRQSIKPAFSPESSDEHKSEEKKEEKDNGDDSGSPASDGKRNWAGLMNVIREKEYKTLIIEGTNSESGTVTQVSEWLTEKAVKFSFLIEDSPISPDALVDLIKDEKPKEFVIWAFVTATYNGKPPNNANKFHKWLKSKISEEGNEKYLENVHFFIFGCGNTNWASTYQKIPNLFGESLQKLGATAITDPAEFDDAKDEVEDVFGEYYKTMAPALMHSLPAIGDSKLRKVNEENGGDNGKQSDDEDFSSESKLEARPSSSAITLKVFDEEDTEVVASAVVEKEQYSSLKLLGVTNITPDSSRATWSVRIEQGDLEYRAGDHLVVLPCIAKEYGERVLQHFVDFDFDTVVQFHCDSKQSRRRFKLPVDKKISVDNIFTRLVDLKKKPSKQFILNYSTIVKSDDDCEALEKLVDSDDMNDWLKDHISFLSLM